METYTTTRGTFYPPRQYNRVYEQCLVCERASDDRIHDVEGRQGTGTEAVHAFIGEPEKHLLQLAMNQIWLQGLSRPKGGKPTEEMKKWNVAIEKAKAAVARMFQPIDPHVIEFYDKYFAIVDPPMVRTYFIQNDGRRIFRPPAGSHGERNYLDALKASGNKERTTTETPNFDGTNS